MKLENVAAFESLKLENVSSLHFGKIDTSEEGDFENDDEEF